MTVPCSNPADKLLVQCGTGQTTECRPRDPLFVPAHPGCPGDPLPEFVSDDDYE
jgi:hypothetical protein